MNFVAACESMNRSGDTQHATKILPCSSDYLSASTSRSAVLDCCCCDYLTSSVLRELNEEARKDLT